MEHDRAKALVRTILAHAEAFPWRMQDVGLLGLWLDDRREHRLHPWAPEDREGESYGQLAHELHDSRQVPGTVTLIQFAAKDVTGAELTLCHRPDVPWISGQARDARPDEVKRITAAALAHFA